MERIALAVCPFVHFGYMPFTISAIKAFVRGFARAWVTPFQKQQIDLIGSPGRCDDRAGAVTVMNGVNFCVGMHRGASPCDDAVPGASIAVQTYGDFLNFNPHLHAIVTDGCPRPNR